MVTVREHGFERRAMRPRTLEWATGLVCARARMAMREEVIWLTFKHPLVGMKEYLGEPDVVGDVFFNWMYQKDDIVISIFKFPNTDPSENPEEVSDWIIECLPEKLEAVLNVFSTITPEPLARVRLSPA